MSGKISAEKSFRVDTFFFLARRRNENVESGKMMLASTHKKAKAIAEKLISN